MGTPTSIIVLSVFVVAWLVWNNIPGVFHFDKAKNGYTALTLVLSLQASYAAPLVLLAQNRSADRDRVQAEQDRRRTERNLVDTGYLMSEVSHLKRALADMPTKESFRNEISAFRWALEERRKRRE